MDADNPVIELKAGAGRAVISLAGAEWRSWIVDDAPLLWTPDPAYWPQTAPVLFPVCGWTRNGQARVGGRTYPLGLHGFASQMRFEVAARAEDFVRLFLRDDSRTRALYPFAFELEIEFRLSETRMKTIARARNRGRQVMPYAFGLHPGFCWPFAGGRIEDYAIVFDAVESPQIPVIAPDGLFSTERRAINFDGRNLPLTADTFAREALCFLEARSQGVRFTGPRGVAIRVATDGFAHIILWSRPGAPFLCVESWTGYGDPVGFTGELAQKPGMSHLPPNAEQTHSATYSLEPVADALIS